MTFHTQLENTILKANICYLTKKYFLIIFLLHMHNIISNYWGYLMPFAYCNNIILNFTQMLLLWPIEH